MIKQGSTKAVTALTAALVLVACSTPAKVDVTLHAGDDGRLELAAGAYRVTWQAPGCTYLRLEWAPTSGASIAIPVALPSGSATVTLPAGPGYLNRAGDCDYTVGVASS